MTAMLTATASQATGRTGSTDAAAPVAAVLRGCRRAFFAAFALTFAIDVMSIGPLLYMLNTYDRVMTSRSGVTLVSLTVLILALYAFWSALEWIRSRLMVRLSLRIDWDLAADIFDASFRRHVGRRDTDVHRLLGDLLNLRQFLTGQPVLALMDAPFGIVFIVIGAIFHPYLAAFALIAALLMLAATYLTQKITAPLLRQANDASADANRIAADSLRHAEAALALGMMGALRHLWYAQHRRFLHLQVNASEAAGLMGGVAGFLTKSLPSLQLALGAFLAINGLITGGMVMAASVLISKSVAPIQKLLANWKDIVGARQAYERLNALLADDVVAQSAMALPAPRGALRVSELSGMPPGGRQPVVSAVNFSLEPGQALAIVGPSAAGKTSLTKLLVGVWRPHLGSVRLDGVELADWNHDEIGPQIGYVPQEIAFFDGTVAQNIARLGPVDADRVVEAATLIGMHETILGFPQGYDSRLGAAGLSLSAGQRQRLAIARALYGMPRYLVMDEPNANLDETGEAALARAIDALKQHGASVIITTHRPRLVSSVDFLLVLRAGHQVGFGPARDMLEAARRLQVVAGGGAA